MIDLQPSIHLFLMEYSSTILTLVFLFACFHGQRDFTPAIKVAFVVLDGGWIQPKTK